MHADIRADAYAQRATASGALWRRRRRRSCIQAERNIGGRTGVPAARSKAAGNAVRRDDCAIDNSNRLIIRTGGGTGGEKGNRSRATATAWTLDRYFRGLPLGFFFFFLSFSFADRARTHEVYFGYSRRTVRPCSAENGIGNQPLGGE